jgi:hypothetical protein
MKTTEEHQFASLLSLVRTALFDRAPEIDRFEGMEKRDWEELLDFATRQGVPSIAFDGAKRLPEGLQPPFPLQMAWELAVERIEANYLHRKAVTEELAGILGQEQIPMLVFKGLSLSELYPEPTHREFGDLDIYLFGRQKEGDRLLKKAGAKPSEHQSYKHSVYYYKAVMIENHAHLINVIHSKKFQTLEKYLLEILRKDALLREVRPGEVSLPSARFTALFFTIHAIQHLCMGKFVLRSYCDWALFLHAHREQIEDAEYRSILKETGLLAYADAMTVLACQWLGLEEEGLTVERNPSLEAQLSSQTVNLKVYPDCTNRSVGGRLCYKFKRFIHKHRQRRGIYGQSLGSALWNSILYHLKHPFSILKINPY